MKFIVFLLAGLLLADHKYKETYWVCTGMCLNCIEATISTTSDCKEKPCIPNPYISGNTKVTCDLIPGNHSACCDPHFTMWDDQKFSFHGECDLVLYSNPNFASGTDLVIHIRTQIQKYYSFIKNIAIKVGNHYFEVEERIGKGVNYYNNGKLVERPNTFAGYHVREVENATWCKEKCSETEILSIDFEEWGSLEVGNWAGFLHIQLSLQPANYDSVGLLGKYGEIGYFARNGTVLRSPNSYGQEWQVLDSEPMLFHEPRYPQYPEQCVMPKPTTRRATNEKTRRMAETACTHLSGSLLDMCIFDVEATGDIRMAISPMYV